MSNEKSDAKEVQALKDLIYDFVVGKFEKKQLKSKRQTENSNLIHYDENDVKQWIVKIANSANQRRIVTHSNKFHDPKAKGCGVRLNTTITADDLTFVSTLSIPQNLREKDSTGAAGAMDVNNFLNLEVNDENILSRIIRNDINLIEALPGTENEKREWFELFADMEETVMLSSDTLAKQIYFPVDDSYHLLSPLFPSTLSHHIFKEIQASKYGEDNKIARQARKENRYSEKSNREFPLLAIQHFGGANPQVVSYLNSKRGGKNYLLPSLPPQWKKSTQMKLPYYTPSIFRKNYFPYKVRKQIDSLKKFLEKTTYNNFAIRKTRESMIAEICDQFIIYASRIQLYKPGWSIDSACILESSQKFWLDPGRRDIDKEWNQLRENSDWIREISQEFAEWLNEELQSETLHLGMDEYLEWKHLIKKELLILEDAIS